MVPEVRPSRSTSLSATGCFGATTTEATPTGVQHNCFCDGCDAYPLMVSCWPATNPTGFEMSTPCCFGLIRG